MTGAEADQASAPASEEIPAMHQAPLAPARRRKAIVAGIVIAVYVVTVVVRVLPASPMRDTLLPLSDRLAKPFLTQAWNLFAPDPLRTNQHSIVVVRYRERRGAVKVTEPFDVSAAVRDFTHARRWGPPRVRKALGTLVKVLEVHAFRDARRVRRAGVEVGDLVPAKLVDEILDGRRNILGVWARVLSAVAPQLVPRGATVLELRGYLIQRLIDSFADRDDPAPVPYPPLPEPDDPTVVLPPEVVSSVYGSSDARSYLVMDSGWMPLVRGVAALEVVP